LRLDDTDNIKKIISANSTLPFQGKETVLAMLWKDFTTDEINKKIQRENVIHLVILLHRFRRSNIVFIDDISSITPTTKKVIERLKDTL
jgi:hypothetical protein